MAKVFSQRRESYGGLPQNLPTVLQYSILCVEVFVILIVTQPTAHLADRYACRRRIVCYLIDMATLGFGVMETR